MNHGGVANGTYTAHVLSAQGEHREKNLEELRYLGTLFCRNHLDTPIIRLLPLPGCIGFKQQYTVHVMAVREQIKPGDHFNAIRPKTLLQLVGVL